MQDFQERDGNALFLGTGYDTVPYHIYRGFGFDSVTLGSGFMHYYASSESVFEQDYFAPGTTTVRDIDWRRLGWAYGALRLLPRLLASNVRERQHRPRQL